MGFAKGQSNRLKSSFEGCVEIAFEGEGKENIQGVSIRGVKHAFLGFLLALVSLWLSPMTAWAQAKTYAEEYDKKIKAAETLTAENTNLFGDKINLATGATEFSAVDVSLPGNSNLPVSVRRRFAVEARSGGWNRYLFGDWDIDLPYLGGVFGTAPGWQVAQWQPTTGGYTNSRCSAPTSLSEAAPPEFSVPGATQLVEMWEFWHGYQLHTPEAGDQEMLFASEISQPRPSNGGSYHWVTNKFWYLSCLPSLKSGDPGEGFLALAPDGTKYTFDWMVRLSYPDILKPSGKITSTGPVMVPIGRSEIRLYPSRVEDALGNWVQYDWDGPKLTRITASDGRTLTLTYQTLPNVGDKIATVSDGTRTWSYGYEAQGSLTSVSLPDGSAWTINMKPLDQTALGYDPTQEVAPGGYRRFVYDKAVNCSWMRVLGNNRSVGKMWHPSGAYGEFEFDAVRHGRTFVRQSCMVPPSDDPSAQPADENLSVTIPVRFDVLAIQAKRLSGPGLPTYAWTYHYTTPVGGYIDNCPNCPTTKTTTVDGPEGERDIYTYGVQFEVNDGQLLKTEIYQNGTLLQTSTLTYLANADAGHQAFADRIGMSPQHALPDENENAFFAERLRPQVATTLVRDGVTMSSTVNGFDVFAHPTSITKANPWYHRTDVTSYYNDTAKWVLHQVATVVNSDTNLVVSQTDYDPATTKPIHSYSFGKLQTSMTYNSDGTLNTTTDGNSHVTTFANWKRGLPQLITHADSTFKSAVIDDLGLIRSVTDENGAINSYDYDAMGRMKSITPPEGYATQMVFEPVGAAEYGIPAGHWRQIVTTGNNKKVTYFDALWRPVVNEEADTSSSSSTQRWSVSRYDSAGRTIFASYPRNPNVDGGLNYDAAMPGTTTRYDVLGRTTQLVQDSELGPLTTTTEYLSGVQTRVTNPRGFQTTTGYFFLDEPRYDQPVWIVAPEGARTTIERDVFGKPLNVTRGGSP